MFQTVKNYFRKDEDEVTIANEWHRQCSFTPDIWKLEQSMYQLIFIPDDMMRGKPNNHLIADAGRDGEIPIHPACFTLERFTFWKKEVMKVDAEGKPQVEYTGVPLPKEHEPTNWLRVRPTPAKIKGQLYAILSPRIKKLDIHRQNGVQFIRKRQLITLPYRSVKYNDKPDAVVWDKVPVISPECIRSVEAWMYIGIPEYWDNLIGDMFQVKECRKFELDTPKFWVGDDYYKFE